MKNLPKWRRVKSVPWWAYTANLAVPFAFLVVAFVFDNPWLLAGFPLSGAAICFASEVIWPDVPRPNIWVA